MAPLDDAPVRVPLDGHGLPGCRADEIRRDLIKERLLTLTVLAFTLFGAVSLLTLSLSVCGIVGLPKLVSINKL